MLQSNTIEEYIEFQPQEKKEIIEKMRALIKECALDAIEKISFRMPTYTIDNKIVVHFHTAKSHLGLYPEPEAIDYFKDKLLNYKTAKGVVRFFYEDIPYDLIKEIVLYKVEKIKSGNKGQASQGDS